MVDVSVSGRGGPRRRPEGMADTHLARRRVGSRARGRGRGRRRRSRHRAVCPGEHGRTPRHHSPMLVVCVIPSQAVAPLSGDHVPWA